MEERLYDLVFIVRPATPEEEIKKVLSTLEHACTEKGAKIEKAETWGTRKLAYKVMKHREGIYFYQQVRTSHGELLQRVSATVAATAGGIPAPPTTCAATMISNPWKIPVYRKAER